jgi:hypothetical protein
MDALESERDLWYINGENNSRQQELRHFDFTKARP